MGALARLGVARQRLAGENFSRTGAADADAARVRARAAYKDFLTLGKDARSDVPIVKQGVGGSNPLSPTNLFKHLNCTSGFPSTSMVSKL